MQRGRSTPTGRNVAAGAILVTVPTLEVFPVLRRFIDNGWTSGP
ncbi:MAG TPA: hypothetical protein VGC37_14245 [Friedmanniella sp.]